MPCCGDKVLWSVCIFAKKLHVEESINFKLGRFTLSLLWCLQTHVHISWVCENWDFTVQSLNPVILQIVRRLHNAFHGPN